MAPENHLKLLQNFPDLSKQVEILKSAQDLPAWDKTCFLPIAGWLSIATASGNPYYALLAAHLAGLGTWRYTRHVYQVDPLLAEKLAETQLKDMPVEALKRLPSFALYLDLEQTGFSHLGKKLHGFFAHIEHDVKTQGFELRLLVDHGMSLEEKAAAKQAAPQVPSLLIDSGLTPVVIPLIEGATLEDCMTQIHVADQYKAAIKATAPQVAPLVNLLLYLNSEAPDIHPPPPAFDLSGQIAQKTTKGKLRLFPAPKNKIYKVGEVLSASLKKVQADSQRGARKGPAPHVRRAHWHGYWVGSRTNPVFKQKWLPPTLVVPQDLKEDKIP